MNKNIELEGAGIEKGKELFKELKDGCDGSCVGAETEGTFEFDGETYSIEICGFWESSSHFSYYIFGKGYRTTGTHSIN